MSNALIQDFACSLPADAGLLHADVCAGAPIDQGEVLSLVAASQALFVSACTESRTLDSIDKRRELWADVARLFDELCASWADVNSSDPQIAWLLARLRRYRDLALDRTEIYLVTESQRIQHSKIRGDTDFDMSHHQRHSLEPKGESQPGSPPHIYQIAPMP